MRLRNAGLVTAAALLGLAACADEGKRPASAPSQASAVEGGSRYDKPGFWTREQDGRLWVFRAGSRELQAFQKSGEPARQVTRIGAGPGGMTVKSSDATVIDAYVGAK